MPDKIGRFELVSTLAQSPVATIYKALDTENQQTVALKVVKLSAVKDGSALLKSVLEEADQAKPLSSHNIAVLYGVGDEDGQLLAATEYVQGNSIATTLARNEGFSIWDLQDIARQVCHALDHAAGHKVIHQSLEPEKIMVQWDGQAKILGYGISCMGSHAAEDAGAVAKVLHYASPEKVRGEACDHRSVLFSLGAILYEMATEQKAFPGETAEQVRQAILESQPPLPVRLKPKVSPALSDLIMKVLAKSPDERYQSGKELVLDLEKCKSSNTLATKASAAQKPKVQAVAAGAGPGSSASSGSVAPAANPSAESAPAVGSSGSGLSGSGLSGSGSLSSGSAPKTASSSSSPDLPAPGLPARGLPKVMASAAAVEEPKSGFAVDPMMAEDENSPAAKARRSFSDLSEMPPLKKEYVAPPPPAPSAEAAAVEEPLPQVVLNKSQDEKPKLQVREAAQKAVSEIRGTPPKLYLYAVGTALLVIAIILVGMSMASYWQDRETDGGGSNATPAAAATQPSAAPQAPPQAAPAQPSQATAAPADDANANAQQPAAEAPQADSEAPASTRGERGRKMKTHAVAAAPALAQLTVSSNPAGVQITFDGSPLCVTPCTLTGIAPGQHAILASKNGYTSANRNLVLSSGANTTISMDLNAASAKLSVASNPAGAVILVDGQDTGKLSPAQFLFNTPGAHTVVLRRYGYLDETTTVNAEAGQTATVNLVLKQLGNTDDIRTAGGHFKKVFGGSDAASMGIVSVKTTPKGAQIMVNNRVLDKTAPFDFYLNPGTYVIDITMSGYHSLHKVIVVEEREKVAIEEALTPE
jgi:serine/threonine protein kinase